MTGIAHEDTRETRKYVFIPEGYTAKRRDSPLNKREYTLVELIILVILVNAVAITKIKNSLREPAPGWNP